MQYPGLEAAGKLIRFKTKDGLLLEGFLLAPKHSDTCLIYVHGMTDNFYSTFLPFAMAKKLNRMGVAVFTINTRGHDAAAPISKWNVAKKDSSIGTDFEKFEDCVIDIKGAIAHMRALGHRRFIISGHSTGCQKITYYQYRTKDRNVLGLVLLAPADDYNSDRRELGKEFPKAVALAKRLVRKRQGAAWQGKKFLYFSARRFLSVADVKNVEARLYNYNSDLREYSKIKIPVCAIFGSREKFLPKPVKTCISMLKDKSRSKLFVSKIIRGAKHGFKRHEDEVAIEVSKFVSMVT